MSNTFCMSCGKRLVGRQRLYCSTICKKRSHRLTKYIPFSKRTINCKNCGTSLTGHQSKFCSVTCKNRHYYKPEQSSQTSPNLSKRNWCVICGTPLQGRQRQYCSTRCKSKAHPTYNNQKRLKVRRKLELLQTAGGACQRCGYHRNLASLSFHHLNPAQKQTPLNMYSVIRLSFEQRNRELANCLLLCQNCHQEEHAPHLYLAELEVEQHVQVSLRRNQGTLDRAVEKPEGHCMIGASELRGNQTHYCSAKCRNQHYQSYDEQHRRGVSRKLEFIQQLGNQCGNCGYSVNLSALTFHHVDGFAKEFQLDLRNLANRSRAAIEAELEKCVLLCANCHMETHYPELDISQIDLE